MEEIRPSLCRLCSGYCPILVTVVDGRAVKVTGDPDAPLYEGFTCPKGRALAEQHNGPTRLLHSQKRQPDGSYQPIASARAMDEIADKVQALIAKHGPRSVALYYGTGVYGFYLNTSIAYAWMQAIGSPMVFSAGTIDKPGAYIAQAAHGHWHAGHPPFEEAEAWLIIGLNPLISKSGGFPLNNPGHRLKEAVVERGMKLIAIDPRETESTQRAYIHFKAKPGEDPAILAGMIHVILAEKLYDAEFVAENVQGLEALRAAVAPFSPERVAARADVPAQDVVDAARVFARSKYAGVGCGTGPSFSLVGALTDYLSVTLMTLCGFWSRAGDVVAKPNVLLPAYEPRAEPMAPFPGWGVGERLRVRGLGNTAAGMPTGALADEILTGGEGQVKALFCMSGNPMMAWPDQHRAKAALESLELLVTAELEMSATARLSDYVIAPRLTLEIPGSSAFIEAMKYHGHLRGIEGPYGRYTPAVVDPPPGSDVIADWELYYGLAQRMGLQLVMPNVFGMGQHLEVPTQLDPLDMQVKPTSDDLIELSCRNARIPLDEVKRYPHGHVFSNLREIVRPKRPDCTAKLDVGNAYMMEELAALDGRGAKEGSREFPYLLLSRRSNRILNSAGRLNKMLGGLEPHNPAFLHSRDLSDLGLVAGDIAEISSPHGKVLAVLAVDDGLRPGCVSISQSFGGNPGEEEDPYTTGCNTGRLLSADAEFDRITGIPRIGAVPVAIRPVNTHARP